MEFKAVFSNGLSLVITARHNGEAILAAQALARAYKTILKGVSLC